MALARRRDAWERAASLMALIANCNRDPRKSRPFNASQFMPFDPPARERRPAKEGFRALKAMFNKRGKEKKGTAT